MICLPSASYWWLLELCPASVTYPWSERITPAMEAGTVRHEYLQSLGSGMPVAEALALMPKRWREMCGAIDVGRLRAQPGAYLCEVSVAYEPSTGESFVLGINMTREERSSQLAEFVAGRGTWILGTIDRVGLEPSVLEVRDTKGWWAELEEPEESLQLGIYALAAQAVQEWSRPITRLAFDRVGEDGRVRVGEPVERGSAWLKQMAERVRAIAATVQRALADPKGSPHVEGEHCRRCPALDRCALKRERLALASEVLVMTDPKPVALSSREEASMWAAALPALKEQVARIEADVKAFAAQEPLAGPDGRVYGPEPEDDLAHSEAPLVAAELARWLEEIAPRPPSESPGAHANRMMEIVEEVAVRRQPVVTATGVSALVSEVAPRGQKVRLVRELRGRLRAAGVVKQRQVFEWRKPKLAALPEGES